VTCPVCHGVGWVRKDLPVGHPDFGRAFPCPCIADEVARRRLDGLRRASATPVVEAMTFATFQVDAPGNAPEQVRSLRAAYEAARRFSDRPEGWLVLHGGYGCGKTHLAAAIVNACAGRGEAALFVVVPDLLDHLRAAFAPGADESFDERIDAVRDVPVLVLDDLGTQAPTPWASEKLFQILNHRYNAQLPTVITTNVALEDLDERLRSRLGHMGFVRPFHLTALDYRGGIQPEGLEVSSLQYYADQTFQTWDDRLGDLATDAARNLRRAFDLARAYAEQPEGWLVFIGDNGCGKTHLAAAIANERSGSGQPAVFVVVPDLLDHLRATFSPTSRVQYDRRFEDVRSAALLVLDDLGTESATPWAQEKLYQLLNHRYAARLPTVITMATSVKDVPGRLRSRMLDRTRCTVFEILAPAFHGGLRPSGRSPQGRRSQR
jgi:DNA replication protein DnaC